MKGGYTSGEAGDRDGLVGFVPSSKKPLSDRIARAGIYDISNESLLLGYQDDRIVEAQANVSSLSYLRLYPCWMWNCSTEYEMKRYISQAEAIKNMKKNMEINKKMIASYK